MAAPMSPGGPLDSAVPRTVLFVSDVQERFRDIIYGGPSLISAVSYLVSVFEDLSAPIVLTEQYPKAFGPTVPEVLSQLPDAAPGVLKVEKTLFSMVTDDVHAFLDAHSIRSVVICGLETHICVRQTVRDCLARGLMVYVVVDAVSSQRPFDRTVALRALEASGALLTTCESITFELLRDSKHPRFKSVSALVKKRSEALGGGDDVLHSL